MIEVEAVLFADRWIETIALLLKALKNLATLGSHGHTVTGCINLIRYQDPSVTESSVTARVLSYAT